MFSGFRKCSWSHVGAIEQAEGNHINILIDSCIHDLFRSWEQSGIYHFHARIPECLGQYQYSPGIPIKEFYSSADLPQDLEKKLLGYPGEFPFTRGVYPNMYRGRLWTMRMFSGFGTPEDTNRRLKYLIKHGTYLGKLPW